MFKLFLTGSSVLALLLAGLSAQAQTQAPAPQPKQVAPQANVSQQELQKFTSAIKQLQAIQQQSRTEMVQAVQRQGLSEQRFVQIYQAQQNPQSAAKIPQQEKQNFEKAITQIKAIQQQTQPKMQQAVKSKGLEVERFNQILASVQQNPALQQKVREMLKG